MVCTRDRGFDSVGNRRLRTADQLYLLIDVITHNNLPFALRKDILQASCNPCANNQRKEVSGSIVASIF